MIDGAGKWRQTIHVTIPGILPTIVIMLISKIGRMLNVGMKNHTAYNPSTMSVADVISTYTYRKGLIDLNWSFSSAVGCLIRYKSCVSYRHESFVKNSMKQVYGN
jgi:putative aldouronate transport system permease protein